MTLGPGKDAASLVDARFCRGYSASSICETLRSRGWRQAEAEAFVESRRSHLEKEQLERLREPLEGPAAPGRVARLAVTLGLGLLGVLVLNYLRTV